MVLIIGTSALVSFHARYIRRLMTLACLFLLAVQVRYTTVFSRVAAGTETDANFLAGTVPLMDDFSKLDRILPPDAVLYVPSGYFPSIYCPRPVAFTRDDIRRDQRVFLISEGHRHPRVDGCTDIEYTNDHAVIAAFRTRQPIRDLLQVRRCPNYLVGE